MTKIIIVCGLPGSGKTTCLNQLKQDGRAEVIYDDYYGTPIMEENVPKGLYHNKDPIKNTRFNEIATDIIAGKSIAVSDIAFCIARHRNNFLAAIISINPDIDIEFIFFKKNIKASKENVHNRNRDGRVEKEIDFIDTIGKAYSSIKVKEQSTYVS